MSDVAVWGAMSTLTLTISIQVFDKGSWGYTLDGFYGLDVYLYFPVYF